VFNPVLWAYGRAGELDLMMQLYNSLRGAPGCAQYKHRHPILSRIPKSLVPLPDIVSYTTVIQCLAYHGDLRGALTILRHMLKRSKSKKIYRRWDATPTMEVYRALFLGFAKHSKPPLSPSLDDFTVSSDQPTYSQAQRQEWSYGHLRMLFDNFLALPPSATPPNQRTLYWLLVSLWRTGGQDIDAVDDALEQLIHRWGQAIVLSKGGRVTKFLRECRENGLVALPYNERRKQRNRITWGRSDWSLDEEVG
jgi:pentatricopeptide repeat protein